MYAMTIGVCMCVCVCVCVQAFRSVFIMSVQAISVPLSCVYKHSMCFMRVLLSMLKLCFCVLATILYVFLAL